MVLAIYAARHADEEFTDPVTTVLGAAKYMIGRGNECDIVLEDQTRRVSRQHLTILRRGDGYLLHVISQINPVVINGEVVAPGAQQALRAGDRLIIGEYEFGFVAVDDTEPLSVLPANPVAKAGTALDLDRLFGAQPEPPRAPAVKAPPSDLHDLLGSREHKAADPLLDILGRSGDAARRPAAGTTDPLAQILGHDAASAPATTGSPDEFMHGAGAESPIDALLKGSGVRGTDPLGLSKDAPSVGARGQFGGGIGGSDELDHVHDFHLPFSIGAPSHAPESPPPAAQRPVPAPLLPEPLLPEPVPQPGHTPPAGIDPLAQLLGAAASRPPADDPLGIFGNLPQRASAPDPAPLAPFEPPAPPAPSPFTAPPPRPQAAPEPAPAPVSAPRVAGGSEHAAMAAFLRGAGMQSIDPAQIDSEAFLEECGATVRAAIEGLMGMLLARAKVKEELRASDRTMVAARENNALKLAESAEEALQFVFDPGARADAFLPPPKAVADACADLQTHELALVAGMRAALMGAIKRFEPDVIEKRLQKEGGKSLLANRKAQLWDCFVAYYQQTQAEADDNFERIFGAAFLRAYQEQVRRLSR